jgi:predicted phosphoribosyltransferase
MGSIAPVIAMHAGFSWGRRRAGGYRDRREAGRVLADSLVRRGPWRNPVVLGLARGGVPVAFEVAQRLQAPLDVFVVRKLGFPGQEELAFGAIASGGVMVLNPSLASALSRDEIDAAVRREREELARRERLYRGERPPIPLGGRDVVLVDDGLATGASMLAAIRALKQLHASRIIVAVPVGAAETCAELATEADDVVCALTPVPFDAVGMWYQDFSETTDDEVRQLLDRNTAVVS